MTARLFGMGKTAQTLTAIFAGLFLLGANPAASPTLTERQRALHVLNRLGFGPRPGDIERVLAIGVDDYIVQQLHPERIKDSAVETKLQQYETLRMSDRELLRQFAEMRQMRRDASKNATDAPSPDRPVTPSAARDGMKPNAVAFELTSARLDRAINSERQLNEVMVDFWMNHFNVFAGKGPDRFLIAAYERDTIRPHIWGNFEDLLLATAKSPAMLFYLDNARSIASPSNRPAVGLRGRGGEGVRGRSGGRYGRPLPPMNSARRPVGPSARRENRAQGGLNENYARELLELHTLGVDGGYTQKDVTELARLLTGWSIARPNEQGSSGGFKFRAALHDSKAKTVLGKNFPAGGGLAEGEAMIRYLAHHPATANHIATKLCQRLVSDEPPRQLVDRVAKRFLETGGDLRETVEAVITSPEFFDPKVYRGKVKTPFEFVVSAVRATGATSSRPMALAKVLRDMGQPLYFAQPPTGYSDEAEPWVNTGAIMNRVNFALALAASKVPGTQISLKDESVDALAARLVGGELSAETRRTIHEQLEQQVIAATTPQQKSQLIAGLILGSPEFQKQ